MRALKAEEGLKSLLQEPWSVVERSDFEPKF